MFLRQSSTDHYTRQVLVDCDAELAEFMETMDILGEKLGPIIIQFPFFSSGIFPDRHTFTYRLISKPREAAN